MKDDNKNIKKLLLFLNTPFVYAGLYLVIFSIYTVIEEKLRYIQNDYDMITYAIAFIILLIGVSIIAGSWIMFKRYLEQFLKLWIIQLLVLLPIIALIVIKAPYLFLPPL